MDTSGFDSDEIKARYIKKASEGFVGSAEEGGGQSGFYGDTLYDAYVMSSDEALELFKPKSELCYENPRTSWKLYEYEKVPVNNGTKMVFKWPPVPRDGWWPDGKMAIKGGWFLVVRDKRNSGNRDEWFIPGNFGGPYESKDDPNLRKWLESYSGAREINWDFCSESGTGTHEFPSSDEEGVPRSDKGCGVPVCMSCGFHRRQKTEPDPLERCFCGWAVNEYTMGHKERKQYTQEELDNLGRTELMDKGETIDPDSGRTGYLPDDSF